MRPRHKKCFFIPVSVTPYLYNNAGVQFKGMIVTYERCADSTNAYLTLPADF